MAAVGDVTRGSVNICGIRKKGVPANGKIVEDAKEIVQECVSEFISFITSKHVGKIFYMLEHGYVLIYVTSNNLS
nr:nuclear transcription factor Y subunit B-8 [Tanacetum cinerariifolium]